MPNATKTGQPKVSKAERRRQEIVDMAKEIYHKDGEVEVDDNAKLSESGPGGDNGCYVQAWVWVGFEATKFSKRKDR